MAELFTTFDIEPALPTISGTTPITGAPKLTIGMRPNVQIRPDDLGKLAIAVPRLQNRNDRLFAQYIRYFFLTPAASEPVLFANGLDGVASLDACIRLFATAEDALKAALERDFPYVCLALVTGDCAIAVLERVGDFIREHPDDHYQKLRTSRQVAARKRRLVAHYTKAPDAVDYLGMDGAEP